MYRLSPKVRLPYTATSHEQPGKPRHHSAAHSHIYDLSYGLDVNRRLIVPDGTETAGTGLGIIKTAENGGLSHPARESAKARECVVGPGGLEPPTKRL